MNQRWWLINSIKPTARQVPPIVRCAWFRVWLSASRRFVGRVSLFNPNTQQVVKTKPPAVWLAVAGDAQFAINHLHCLIRRSRPIPAFGVCCKLPFRFAGRQSITVRSPYDHRTTTVRSSCTLPWSFQRAATPIDFFRLLQRLPLRVENASGWCLYLPPFQLLANLSLPISQRKFHSCLPLSLCELVRNSQVCADCSLFRTVDSAGVPPRQWKPIECANWLAGARLR